MTVRSTENRPAPPAPAALLFLAAAVLLAASPPAPVATGPAPGSARGSERTVPVAATVEPTLPLRIDLSFDSIERGGGRARGRLVVELVAIDEVRDLEVDLRHDDALTIPEAANLRRERLRLRRGERRAFRMAVEGRGERDLPLRIEATFRTADGLALSLGQGITLQKARPNGEARLHLGALEYPALVLDGPIP